ncbi:hypothetical protein C8F04DRAFT_1153756 [Mycena alexandri]|uniref:F-box domain-containing protein n=1 Tax=Mycena alexandri TaxID=1745969 RepID=A0AAD6WR54_9AGAR|nr:hypothetical protein C8F04DRAFT_1153756 [Mycena alexandri]
MISPFAGLLGTNYCPTDEEVSEIRVLLVDPAHRLKHLNDAITELQTALDKLVEERDGLVAYMDGHKALISPVRRLPLDVIQEIFIACMPTHRNCVMSALEAPVLLGRICSSWRTIAYSTPRLWARVHIVEPLFYTINRLDPASIDSDAKAAQRFAATKEWLGRSGQCPLSISLQNGPDHRPLNATSPTPCFLQALVLFASRWEHMEFTLSFVAFNAISHLTKTDVPLLKSIKFLYQYQIPPQRADLEEFTMLQGPRFSSFCALDTKVITEGLPLPWNQLTVLELTGPSWESLTNSESLLLFLERCPQLHTCKLSMNDRELTRPPSSAALIEFASLRTLELDCEGLEMTVTHLFDRLSLPGLRNFALVGQITSQHAPSLAQFFARSSRLERLEIRSYTFSRSSLLESLRGLPGTMRELIIHDFPHRSSYIDSAITLDDDVLALLGGDSTPCPALETLHLNHCTNVSDEALLQFIMAHMSGESQTKLKYIKVQFDRRMTLDIFSSLPPFVSSNLGLFITHVPPLKMRFSPWQGVDDDPFEHIPDPPDV